MRSLGIFFHGAFIPKASEIQLPISLPALDCPGFTRLPAHPHLPNRNNFIKCPCCRLLVKQLSRKSSGDEFRSGVSFPGMLFLDLHMRGLNVSISAASQSGHSYPPNALLLR